MIQPAPRRFLVALVTLLAAACQPASSGVGLPASTTSTAASGAPAPGVTAGPSDLASATSTAAPSVAAGALDIGPGSFFLADPRIGLDALTSYTETLVLSFDGATDGIASTWSTTYRLRRTAAPAATILSVTATGTTPDPDPRLVGEAAGARYVVHADGTCTVGAAAGDSPLSVLDPARQLPGLMGADAAGSAVLAGVSAARYTFDGRALLEANGPATSGEVWIAPESGTVLKYHRSTTGDAEYFGGGLAGTMTWDYVLDEVTADAGAGLPAACQLDVPIMPGASNVLVLPSYAGFDTTSTVATITAFYKAQLPSHGWAFDAIEYQAGSTAVITFTSGARRLNVLVTPGAAGVRVDLAPTAGG